MTEDTFLNTLKKVTNLTTQGTLEWQEISSDCFMIVIKSATFILSRTRTLGTFLEVSNSDNKVIAAASSSEPFHSKDILSVKSSIPEYLFAFLINRNLKTDKTFEEINDFLDGL